MIVKKNTENRIRKAIFGLFFAIIALFGGISTVGLTEPVYAEPAGETGEEVGTEDAEETAEEKIKKPSVSGSVCKDSLGSTGWSICPGTGKIAEAVDWLYEKIEDILQINPVEIKDGTPTYEIWKYFRGVTNIVFIIFLLVVVYSQLTGLGISNYGVKKVLPKLIVTAILVNLSFILCSLAVDLSNVIGNSLRGVFLWIEESTYANIQVSDEAMLSLENIYDVLTGAGLLSLGIGLISFESGAIWMLIPVVLGAFVAVASGLITVAFRQAVVTLLIMVAPLAIVAYILPNTEQWFKKWKQLFIKMLVFYPMFSVLFGASSLAGYAIMASAKDGFGLILGKAVQILPLFLSWNLMKMSGTFLSTVNAKIRSLSAKPLASTRSWAESRKMATKQKYLASNNVYTPSLYLRQYLSDRKIHREEETKEHAEIVKNRGLAYSAKRNYTNDGKINRDGEKAYIDQARNMNYQRTILWHKNNFNEGLAKYYAGDAVQKKRLEELDKLNMDSSDYLKIETARGELIEKRNAEGFHKRMETAMNAHMDKLHWDRRDKDGNLIYERHFASQSGSDFLEAENRYNNVNKIMHGNLDDNQYAAAYAAHAFDTQNKIIQTKFQKYFELAPPTRDVRYRVEELSRLSTQLEDGSFSTRAVDNIDTIISGLRVLNQRGDTDFLKDIMDDVLDKKYGGLELGTHASQALASFLMFEVKDNDPYLRRFGKYINLETARRFDKNERQKETVDYEEYVKGYHYEPDGTKMYAKKDMVKLMEGTSLDGIERTALDNYDASLRKAYTDENGVLDVEAYEAKRRQVDKSTGPQFISANMKYLSGSEQIASAVKSKTGFMAKQNKETGKYEMVALWNDEKEAEALFRKYKDDPEKWAEAKDNLEKFYRDQTLQYLQDQTPAQILGLRSDYREPLLEHLSKAYLLDEDGNIDEEKMREHNEKLAAIESDDFGETSADKIAEKRKSAKEAVRMSEAGETFRELLYKKGKLAQIEKSKRSGAANNAKDWVRGLLLLDGENDLKKWIYKRDKQEVGNESVMSQEEQQKKTVKIDEREQQKKIDLERQVQKRQQREEMIKMIKELKEREQKEADSNLTPDRPSLSVYTPEKVAEFTDYVDDKWQEMRNDDDDDGRDEFFNDTHDYVVKNIGAESYVAKMYEKYYRDNPDSDMHELCECLKELLEALLQD